MSWLTVDQSSLNDGLIAGEVDARWASLQVSKVTQMAVIPAADNATAKCRTDPVDYPSWKILKK